MFLFPKPKKFLGIDLGSTSIKLVELYKKGGFPVLSTYGYIERPAEQNWRLSENVEEAIPQLVAYLKKLYQNSGASGYEVITALPNFSVFNSTIMVPVMKDKELKSAITWEAKKFVPLPIEDLILDWKIIETVQIDREQKYKILLTVAAKDLAKRYMEVFRQADLQLTALETEAFALARALIGRDPSPVMVVDASAMSSDVIIVEKGIPILNRSIDVGGVSITRAIANSLGVDFNRADQFKRDIGMAGPSKIPKLIEVVLKPVIDEINYSLNLYQGQTQKKIEKVILSGGSAYLPNFDQYLSKIINLKVIVGDPWARIAYPAELKPALEEIAPRFAVTIGLALRQFE